ncbi:MAG TPA: helix-turn-helix domain-containing protein, partial [Terrimesophilobacter sp.]|nr:helix-turn-helix domain-containing protein [Terrimesophilobacter sp.]
PHLPSSGFHLLAFGSVEGIRIARAVALLDLPVIVGQGRTSHLALVPSDAVPQMRELVASLEVRVGVSSVFTDLADVRVASQEAAKVFEANQHGQPRWIDFEGTTVSVLARSLREATEIVAGTLGHLADDAPAMAKLRDTLFAYLRNDRRWQESATELGIHRQTLSYRLNRIEEETGLKLARSSDLAALWIAYQAWEATHPR